MVTGESKEFIAARICSHLDIPMPGFSTGSTEPKEIFICICDALGLSFNQSLTKPTLAKFIVESAGHQWMDFYESNGGTVTKEGLLAVETAVRFFRP